MSSQPHSADSNESYSEIGRILVATRCVFAFVILPLLVVVFINAFSYWQQRLDETASNIILIVWAFAMILWFPKIILAIAFQRRHLSAARQMRINEWLEIRTARKIELYIWKTGNSICNAIAFRTIFGRIQILFSDLLLPYFSDRELAAIARHELAHLKRGHASMRLVSIVSPMTILVWLDLLLDTRWLLDGSGDPLRVVYTPTGISLFLLTSIFSIFLYRIVSHSCEFDADRTSVSIYKNDIAEIDPIAADDLISALKKMSIVYYERRERKTWSHPTLTERINRLR